MSKKKKKIVKDLKRNRIETRNMFGPVTELYYYKKLFKKVRTKFSNAELVHKQGFYINCSSTLKEEEQNKIIKVIKTSIK
ncbi:DegT/DnrJ/EryC1/StrS family aminotransferase [Candidatus Woesearchaeota archaeon]|nr:DegT/DnrJ/EryC1/StrS family aminotransferase [Candidatus Woesearchaeota archaeon]